jgi:uncharacterized protein YndB with AHSA1/START domain
MNSPSPVTAEPVRTSIVVESPVERAFEVFTVGMPSWWPEAHHLIEAELAEMIFEPHVGGHIIDRGIDGSECRWATILAYDPPRRVVFSWNITVEWTPESDPARCSEVEMTFSAQTPQRTVVELEHRHIERHGPGWEEMRDALASPRGWGGGLWGYAAAAEAGALGDR